MNTIESIKALSPANQQEEMAKIIIDKPEFLLVQGVEFLGNHAFQCWIKAESNVQIEIGYGTDFTLYDVTTEWQQIQWKFKAETIDDLYMWFPIGTYYVYNTKLERGTTFTDYTESDEDLVKEFESKIEQSADSIKLYVGETYTLKETTTGLEERISKNESSITQTAEEIESLVTRVGEAETSVEQTADSITALATRLDGDETKITQNANSITSLATRVDGAESSITQNANQIALKVSKGDVSSQISAETGQVSIKSNRFVLESTNCSITKNGTITAKNGNFTGTITSSNATITGGSVNVIGTGTSDTKISVKNSAGTYSTAIAPAFIDIEFGSNYSTQLTAGQQMGSVGTCAMVANDRTNLMGLGATGLNFGSKSSSSLKAYYRANAAYVGGNITADGSIYAGSGKTAWNDGKAGWYLGADGTAHVTHTASPYIGFHYKNAAAATSSIQETSAGVITITDGLKINSNSVIIKLVLGGYTVTTGAGTSKQILTDATLKSYYSGYDPDKTIVLLANGWGDQCGTHFHSATYLVSSKAWYATFASSIASSTQMQITYLVICWA